MFLKNIKIQNYKNLSDIEVSLNSKINCLTGDNGVGKTNFLDAIYFICTTRSYFNKIDSQNIRQGQKYFFISTDIETQQGRNSVTASFSEIGKIFKLDGKRIKKLRNYYGTFPAIFITPNDIELIYEGSEFRRNFIDAIISIFDKEYLVDLSSYKKILVQRNSLLKQKQNFGEEILKIYDEKLISLAPNIYKKRKSFVDEFLPIFRQYYNNLSEKFENPEIIYKTDLENATMQELLATNKEKDRILMRTSAGIHKDDLVFILNGRSLKKAGSQGQQKSFLIALKFAQNDFIKKHTGKKPVLLLDDIFDKLDVKRVTNVVKMVASQDFGQIFITHTNKERMTEILQNAIDNYSVFEMQNGEIL